MKYFIDTEFIEGKQDKTFLGIKYGESKPTIDLISIGIVAEDGREYYAISKDFNLKEAWNRYDLVTNEYTKGFSFEKEYETEKVYWIRDNVLKPILEELENYECSNKSPIGNKPNYKYPKLSHHVQKILSNIGIAWHNEYSGECTFDFGCCTNIGKYWLRIKPRPYNRLKRLIKRYGKTNKQIAEEIKHFVANRPINSNKEQWILDYDTKDVQFYGYYSDYDWVVFCWLFGKMIDLPKGFPMYCIDLKQILDDYISKTWKDVEMSTFGHDGITLDKLKQYPNYPKQTNEHNALADAKWNYELYNFLNNL